MRLTADGEPRYRNARNGAAQTAGPRRLPAPNPGGLPQMRSSNHVTV
jgi:hypothetical protein